MTEGNDLDGLSGEQRLQSKDKEEMNEIDEKRGMEELKLREIVEEWRRRRMSDQQKAAEGRARTKHRRKLGAKVSPIYLYTIHMVWFDLHGSV